MPHHSDPDFIPRPMNPLLPQISTSDQLPANASLRDLAISLAFEGLSNADISLLTGLTTADITSLDSRLAIARATRRLAVLQLQWNKAHEGIATIVAGLIKAERADIPSEDTEPLLDEKVG